MIAILAIADGADGEHDAHAWVLLPQQSYGPTQIAGTLLYRQLLLSEERLRPLLAVVHDVTSFLQPIHAVGAQRQESRLTSGIAQPLDGVQDAGRIIHRAEGIDCHGEAFLGEPLPDAVGKARPHEEHLLARPYPKARILNIHYCPEFHNKIIFDLQIFDLRFVSFERRQCGVSHYLLFSASANLQALCRERHVHEAGILVDSIIA